jgi:hypothetical protein
MSLDTPYTPQQALNNFQLFTELLPTATRHEDIADICRDILRRGIIGDNEHPAKNPARDILLTLLDIYHQIKDDGGEGITDDDWLVAAQIVGWEPENIE